MEKNSSKPEQVKFEDLVKEMLSREVSNGISLKDIDCGAKIRLKRGRVAVGAWFNGPLRFLILVAIVVIIIFNYHGDKSPLMKLLSLVK